MPELHIYSNEKSEDLDKNNKIMEKITLEEIKSRLKYKKLNFDGGYLYNQKLISKFKDMGVYDYTTYLAIYTKEGTVILHYQYEVDGEHHEDWLTSYGTKDIFMYILDKTVYSGRSKIV